MLGQLNQPGNGDDDAGISASSLGESAQLARLANVFGSDVANEILALASKLSHPDRPSPDHLRDAAASYFSALGSSMLEQHAAAVSCEITSEPQPIPSREA